MIVSDRTEHSACTKTNKRSNGGGVWWNPGVRFVCKGKGSLRDQARPKGDPSLSTSESKRRIQSLPDLSFWRETKPTHVYVQVTVSNADHPVRTTKRRRYPQRGRVPSQRSLGTFNAERNTTRHVWLDASGLAKRRFSHANRRDLFRSKSHRWKGNTLDRAKRSSIFARFLQRKHPPKDDRSEQDVGSRAFEDRSTRRHPTVPSFAMHASLHRRAHPTFHSRQRSDALENTFESTTGRGMDLRFSAIEE